MVGLAFTHSRVGRHLAADVVNETMDGNRLASRASHLALRHRDGGACVVVALARHAKNLGTRAAGCRSGTIFTGDTRLGRFPAFQVFSVVPALRPLRWCKFPDSEPVNDLGEWRNWYIEKRLGVQLKYFSLDTQAKLEKEREKLNRWATRLLDVSLAFAAAGFVAMLFNFTSFFGGARLEVILGAAGIMSVVALILVQTFAEVEALNHQIAVCVRQREAIERAQARLYNVNSPELAIALVDEIERQLLQENIDWYFRFEHSQHFCSMRRTPETIEGIRPVSHAWHFRWANAAFARLGVMIQFVLGVVIGRLPWMLFAGGICRAMAWAAPGA